MLLTKNSATFPLSVPPPLVLSFASSPLSVFRLFLISSFLVLHISCRPRLRQFCPARTQTRCTPTHTTTYSTQKHAHVILLSSPAAPSHFNPKMSFPVYSAAFFTFLVQRFHKPCSPEKKYSTLPHFVPSSGHLYLIFFSPMTSLAVFLFFFLFSFFFRPTFPPSILQVASQLFFSSLRRPDFHSLNPLFFFPPFCSSLFFLLLLSSPSEPTSL
ncbi:hypothetical protein DFJ73DRAFT_831005, partial [Zopfochytrium polystomum]